MFFPSNLVALVLKAGVMLIRQLEQSAQSRDLWIAQGFVWSVFPCLLLRLIIAAKGGKEGT